MEKKYKELSKTAMSRKHFLQFIAGGLLALFGLHNLIAYLSRQNPAAMHTSAETPSRGFGSSKFGV